MSDYGVLAPIGAEELRRMAHIYIWWLTPDEVLQRPDRLIARIMDIGDFDDIQRMNRAVGDEYLRGILKRAEVGQFSPRSWAYWHYRLGLAEPDHLPPLPRRQLGDGNRSAL